jgi:hypothetical protein
MRRAAGGVEVLVTAVWPERLGVGDRVRYAGRAYTVTHLSGRLVGLTDALGDVQRIDVAVLCRSEGFGVLEQGHKPPPVRRPRLGFVAEQEARWWHPHIVEVLTGLRPDAPEGAEPREQFDPERCTLAQREAAKARELTAGGMPVSARTVRRRRQRYEAEGLGGLADGRSGRREVLGARWDERVLEALKVAASSCTTRGEPTIEEVRRRAQWLLQGPVSSGELAFPSRSSFHRLYTEAAASGLLNGRDRWPGRHVVVEAVRIPHPSSLPQGLQVVFAVDTDTAVVLTAVVCEDAGPVDGRVLVARMCVPADLRAEWPSRAAPAQCAIPLVRPMTLVCGWGVGDRGLAEACRRHGIQLLRPRTFAPSERPHGERLVSQAAHSFKEYLVSATARGAPADGWSTATVQELLDRWAAEVWNHTAPPPFAAGPRYGRASGSPAQRYDTLVARIGWVATPLPPQDFLDLLVTRSRTVGPAGLFLDRRRYDGSVLNGLRSHKSSPGGNRSRFEIRTDPYHAAHVWLRDPSGQWLTVSAATASGPLRMSPISASERVEARGIKATPSPLRTRQLSSRTAEGAPTPVRYEPAQSPAPEDSDRVRATYHAQLPIEPPVLMAAIDRIEQQIMLNEHAPATRYGLLLHGPPGIGKTTVLDKVAQRHTARMARRPNGPPVPVVYVRLPPATTPRMLLNELAWAVEFPPRARAALTDLARHVCGAITTAGTGLILVDECHYLQAAPGTTARLQEVVDYLCDRIPATFVFASIPPQLGDTGRQLWPERTQRRLVQVALTPTPPGSSWEATVARAERALRLHRHAPGTLVQMADHLHHLTGGRTDHLAYLLRSGAIRAIHDGSEALTRDALDILAVSFSLSRP